MLPKWHLFLGTIFALVLFVLFPHMGLVGVLLIIASTVLIDFDHYVYYAFNKRDLNLKRAYIWFVKMQKKLYLLSRKKRNEISGVFLFLHGVEPLLILFILGIYISNYIFYILIGFTLHLIFDIVYQIKIHDRLDRISIIYDFIKFKKLKSI